MAAQVERGRRYEATNGDDFLTSGNLIGKLLILCKKMTKKTTTQATVCMQKACGSLQIDSFRSCQNAAGNPMVADDENITLRL